MGVGLGLAAAVCWGLADIVATGAARRIGPVTVALGFHVLSLVGLVVAAVASDGFGGTGAGDLPVFVGLGVLGAISYTAFYRALEIGPISIVSPVVSAYAAPVVVLSVLILDERLGAGQIAAVVVVILGALVACADPAAIRATERVALLGLGLALVTILSLSGFTFGISYYTEKHGLVAPFLIARIFTIVFLTAVAARGGLPRIPFRERRVAVALVALAALDTAGYFAFNVGVRHAETSVVGTATAPYSILPILAGVLMLGERPARPQWLGIALVIGGLVLLGLSS